MEPQANKPEEKKKTNYYFYLSIVLLIVCAFLTWKLISFKNQIEVVTIEKEQLSDDKDQMIAKLENLQKEYDKLSAENTQLTDMFNAEKEHVEKLLAQIKKSEGSAAKFKNQVLALESRLKEYEEQIEELKKQNKELIAENFNIKTSLDSAIVQNKDLSSKNEDLTDKVAKGSVLTTYDINAGGIVTKTKGKEIPTKKPKKADKIRVCFTIGENAIVAAGPKTVYLRISDPSGNVLSAGTGDEYSFEHQGKKIQFTAREQVNYQNAAQDICLYWTKTAEFSAGTYYVDIFADGNVIGSTTFAFEK